MFFICISSNDIFQKVIINRDICQTIYILHITITSSSLNVSGYSSRNPLPICVYIIENYFRLTVTNFLFFVSAFDGRIQYHVALQELQIGNILTYFLLQSCSNNNNRKPSASITISFFTNNFYFWKIDVSNIINKSIRFETNKCTLGTCL